MLPARLSRRLMRALPLLAAALPGGAGGAAEAPAAPDCPGPRAAAAAPSRTGPTLLLDRSFPDPFVARFGGGYYGYATGVAGNVQVVRSRDMVRWSAPAEALPAARLPAWVDRAHPQVWAPEAIPVGGRTLLYFNARHATLTRTETPPGGPVVLKRHCIGVATAGRPDGPFSGTPAPLVCARFANGVIDPSPFRDGKRLYLLFKDDSNCCAPGSALYVQRLSEDGLRAVGAPRRLLANNDSPESVDDWEWRVVEAPTMVRRKSGWYLFYSGNFFGNRNYAVGYLSCAGPMGPCTDRGHNPILWSHPGSRLIGPGHQSVLQARGRTLIFFHGWNADPDGRERPGFHRRCLYVSAVRWEPVAGGEERPRVAGGTPEDSR